MSESTEYYCDFFFLLKPLSHSGPQVTMAMKSKKERFHVGALTLDLEREMSQGEGLL